MRKYIPETELELKARWRAADRKMRQDDFKLFKNVCIAELAVVVAAYITATLLHLIEAVEIIMG
jgi:hypothetical protein